MADRDPGAVEGELMDQLLRQPGELQQSIVALYGFLLELSYEKSMFCALSHAAGARAHLQKLEQGIHNIQKDLDELEAFRREVLLPRSQP